MQRLNHREASPGAVRSLLDMRSYLHACGLDAKLRLLVEVRISQINGCAYCVDQHVHEARAGGEIQQRLDCLSVWRDVPFFEPRERAALAWAESLTLIADTHAPDEAFAEMRAHFDDKEIVDLSLAISAMNAWNRFGIGFRVSPMKRSDDV